LLIVDRSDWQRNQLANIAARAANSAKPSAKNINSILMAIPRRQFVALQSKYEADYKED
jgi:hypothetical protein